MNKYDLSNKVAIVTGGAQGFGLAITKKFLDSGAEVIIWDIDKKACETAINSSKGKKVSYEVIDITNFKDVDEKVKEISKKRKLIYL